MKKRKCVVYKSAYFVHKTIDKKVKDMLFNLVMPTILCLSRHTLISLILSDLQ